MGLFKWLFGVGDDVKDKEGQKGKVRRFDSEGFVAVDYKDEKTGKVTQKSKFGGNLEKVDE